MGANNEANKGENIKVNTLKTKANEVLDENRDKIKEFIEKRYISVQESVPNNEEGAYKDKPIIYKIYPNDNKYRLNIDIFNFPALLRKENGFFTIVNKISIIFKYFSDKMKNISKDEYERNFPIFFKSILNCDVNKFNELIGTKVQEEELNNLKQGLEKIIRYFGIENTEKTLNILNSLGIGIFSTLTAIPISFIASILSSACIGLGIGIAIGFVSFYLFTKFNDGQKKMFENNKIILENFFEEIKTFNFDTFNNCNIFVIAIDKNGNQIKDICLFPGIMGNLNPFDFPTIGGSDNGESNLKYYEDLLKGTQYFIENYQKKLGSKETFTNDMMNDLKRDINLLISEDENTIKEKIQKKLKEVFIAESLKNNHCNTNQSQISDNSNNRFRSCRTQPNSEMDLENFFPKVNPNTINEIKDIKFNGSTNQNQKSLVKNY